MNRRDWLVNKIMTRGIIWDNKIQPKQERHVAHQLAIETSTHVAHQLASEIKVSL